MRHRYLDGFYVQLFGEINGCPYGLASFSRQTKNEVAVNYQAELLAIFGELACTLNRSSLFNVFQDLLFAGLVADNQKPAPRLTHRLQGFVVGGHA